MSPTKQKILLTLLTGVALGFSYSPNMQYRIIKEMGREWKKINKEKLKRDIRDLYRSHLIEEKENSDGSLTYVLTKKGKLKALTYHFNEMKIKKPKWDGKWRIVIFDIPEKLKLTREYLRQKLKDLGFWELQKSVFVIPYPCEEEIDFIIEYFNIRKYVRCGILETIDNDLHLRKIFKL